jgi:hypothetical protein
MYFCKPVYFKTSEKKTPIDPEKISEEIFPNL